MSNTRFWNWTVPLVSGATAKAEDVNNGFDGANVGFDAVELELNRTPMLPSSESGAQHVMPAAAARQGYFMGFDATGTFGVYNEWSADWSAGGFRLRDLPSPTESDEPVTLGYLGSYSADLEGLPAIAGQDGPLYTDGASVSWISQYRLVPEIVAATNPSSVVTYGATNPEWIIQERNLLVDPNGAWGYGYWDTSPSKLSVQNTGSKGWAWENAALVTQTFEHIPGERGFAEAIGDGNGAIDYTASVTLDSVLTAGTITLVIRSYDSSYALIAESTGIEIASTGTQVNARYAETAAPGATTAYLAVVLKFAGVSAIANAISIRDIKLEAGSNATPFNDDATIREIASTLPPGKNLLMNGDFRFWQESTSITATAASVFLADGWHRATDANANEYTFSRQTAAVTGIAVPQYCMRIQRNNAGTDTATQWIGQALESVDSYPYIGKRLVVSFKARKGALWSGTTMTPTLRLGGGAGESLTGGTGHIFPTTINGQIGVGVSNIATLLTTSWQTFVVAFPDPVDNLVTQIGLQFGVQWPAGASGATDYVDVTDAQLEVGSKATAFEREPYDAAFRRVQRRYFKTFPQATAPAQNAGVTGAYVFTQVVAAAASQCTPLPVPEWMRQIAGTITTYNPSAANAQPRNTTVNADCASVAATSDAAACAFATLAAAAGSAVGNTNRVHYTVDKRL